MAATSALARATVGSPLHVGAPSSCSSSSSLAAPRAPMTRPRTLARCARATYCFSFVRSASSRSGSCSAASSLSSLSTTTTTAAAAARPAGRRRATTTTTARAQQASPPAETSGGGSDPGSGSGNGEVVGGGAGGRLTPADLDAFAKRKAGRASSAAGRVGEALASASLVVVGPSTDLNEAVSRAVGKRLGWFPVSTRRVLLGLHKAADEAELAARLRAAEPAPSSSSSSDADLVGAAEAEVLRGLSSQFRCCVATLGGRASAAGAAAAAAGDAQDALRRQLAGTLVLWVEELDKRAAGATSSASSSSSGGKRASPSTGAAMVERATPAQRPYAALAEVRVALEVPSGGFGAASNLTPEQKAEKAASQIVATLARVLEQDEDLGARKRAYVEEVLIGRERLAEAAEARAEGLERAQQAMEEARRQQQREDGGGAGGGGGGEDEAAGR